jgi:hypothetical protein
MNPRDVDPIEFFNEWFLEPIVVTDHSVAGIIDALNRHPLADDQTAQDYVMPTRRCRERAGRFRIYGENQDVYYCFVYDGDETKLDPPVYFESCLDLKIDYGINESDIIGNDHVLVANRFTDFLWQMLGHHICLRLESSGQFSDGVTGICSDDPIQLNHSFINPLGREFPAGYTCFVSDDVICIPGWGAAFLTAVARKAFINRYSPIVSRQWA